MPAPAPDKAMRLAARHHVSGRLREAAALYRRVLQDDPRNAEALHALGVMAWQTGRPEAAEKLLLRAVDADPHSVPANDDLGCLHFIAGRTEQAAAAFARAAAADPSHVAAHAHLGAALARLGRFEQAVAAYQRAVDVGLVHRKRRDVSIDIGPFAVTGDEAELPPPVAPDEPAVPAAAHVDPPTIVGENVETADALLAEEPTIAGIAPIDPSTVVVTTDVGHDVAEVPAEVAPLPAASHEPSPFDEVTAAASAPDSLAYVEPHVPHVFASEPIWEDAEPAVMVVSAAEAREHSEAAVDVSADYEPEGVQVETLALGEAAGPPHPVGADLAAARHSVPPAVAVTTEPAWHPPAEVEPNGIARDVHSTVGEWGPPPGEEPAWSADGTAAEVEPTPSVEVSTDPESAVVEPPHASDEPAAESTGYAPPEAVDTEPTDGENGFAVTTVVESEAYPTDDGSYQVAGEPPIPLADEDGVQPPAVELAPEAEATEFVEPIPLAGADGPIELAEVEPEPEQTSSVEPEPLLEPEPEPAADEAFAIPLVEPRTAETAVADSRGPSVKPVPVEPASEPTATADEDAGESEPSETDGEAEDASEVGPDDVNHPSNADVHDPLATTRRMSKQLRRARRAPTADGRAAVALHKEGTALLRQRRVDEAIAVLGQLVAMHPTSAKAHRDLGCAYLRADRLDHAAASLVRALQLRPKFGDAFASLGDVYHLQGKVDDAAACYRRALSLRPSADKTHSNLLLTLNYHRKLDPRALFAEHLKWAQAHARPLAAEAAAPHHNDPSPDRPLRIGYVSPDFRRHSVNFFIEPALAHRTRADFHVTAYSDAIRVDDVTDRLANLCDQWRDIRGMTDDAVARLVREDEIDVLVDLAGHTGTNRLRVFARKPAPVQVTYLGYPNTTGLDTIDYRLTDNAADPMGYTEALHTEQLVRLPSFLCYQPPAEAPPVAPPPGMKNGGPWPPGRVTFGCFNVLSKVTPETLSLWAKIMTVLPESRLVMKDRLGTLNNPARRRFVQDIFAYHRVAPERLDLLGKEPSFAAHLAAYGKVDITLDPFPYNGTTTTCESLWMGVPVIALAGNRHAARVGVSILTAAGFTEFVAQSPEAYARAAVVLARDTTRLALLRRTMRQRLSASTLLDAPRFGANLERIYRQMWQVWCARQAAGDVGQADTLSLRDE